MNVPSSMTIPEVLAPAGNLSAVYAAISAGADAVYFGVDGLFNARAKSDGISSEQLADVVQRCHRSGLKALVTINTLIFESELSRVALLIEQIASSGIDALIVQDPAVALLARNIAPTLEVHASTQMTISSPEAAHFAKDLNVTRIVVPRELSIGEIKTFKEQCDLELEVFIHGALCMSWSGQCLTSEAWGGRSANRGQCAQSCRMPYDLLVDDELKPLGEIKYLLSPRDLAGIRAVESLMKIGIECLKIEGRYKGTAYVQQTVETYKGWINSLLSQQSHLSEVQSQLSRDLTDLSLTYSRGFSDGFLGGSDHQSLVEGRFPKHRGVFLGYVVGLDREWIRISTQGDGRKYNLNARGTRSDPLPIYSTNPQDIEYQAEHLREKGPKLGELQIEPGMGVVFDQGEPETDEYGGRIAEIKYSQKDFSMRLYRDPTKNHAAHQEIIGQRVWVNHHPKLQTLADKQVKRAREGKEYERLGLILDVTGEIGAPLMVTATLTASHQRYYGIQVTLSSTEILVSNKERPLSYEILKSKLASFGGSAFHLESLNLSLTQSCGLPVSALKKLKRAIIHNLLRKMGDIQAHSIEQPALMALQILKSSYSSQSHRSSVYTSDSYHPRLIPLCRTMDQLEAVIAYTQSNTSTVVDEVDLDWMEFIGLRKAVERAKAIGFKVNIATVRVQKPGESGYDKRIATLKPDGVLIRHWGALTHFTDLPKEERPVLHGDYSLNVTNSLTAHHISNYGLQSITAAHDLDAQQLLRMMESFPAQNVTVTIHHHIPTFHTEHCVYAHHLSDGRDYKTCGRPCGNRRIALQDHKGQAHPVLVDVECRNTVFNAAAQTAAHLVKDLVKHKVGRLRLEFVWENFEQTQRVLLAYHELLNEKISPRSLLERLGVHEQFGLTAGTMEVIQ